MADLTKKGNMRMVHMPEVAGSIPVAPTLTFLGCAAIVVALAGSSATGAVMTTPVICMVNLNPQATEPRKLKFANGQEMTVGEQRADMTPVKAHVNTLTGDVTFYFRSGRNPMLINADAPLPDPQPNTPRLLQKYLHQSAMRLVHQISTFGCEAE